MFVTHDCTIRNPSFRFMDYIIPFFDIFCVFAQELKGKFLIKGKRLNKLDAAFNSNGTIEDGTVSEEDEAAESKEKENDQKSKSKVAEALNTAAQRSEWRNKTDPLSRLLLEIQNQTRQ